MMIEESCFSLKQGKGGLVPTALNDGPSSFIPLSEVSLPFA